ncbi:phosphoglycerol transferase MdoB-like AlkP superfamily enzyme [Paenibacillus sp. LBL]|uniref:hypothetical protein n=1 Tax=Paenibacillus sp. LBL TaxID=2940563 RepID=UPI002474BF1E|nr:hypothetical protein [Paenibacillus sp. LBL]MDH6670182.1 phosphoglycerol transferase MdoB-like AlkP superfamily enzyme [Paenibacillus sp. LBL]
MSKQSESKSGGIGVLGLLGVAFIVLKLTGVIDWSWWWVTAPFWGLLALGVVIWVIFYIIAGIVAIFEVITKRRKS